MAPQTADPAYSRAGRGAGFGSRARPGTPVQTPGPHCSDGLRWISGAARRAEGEHGRRSMSPPRDPEPVVHRSSLGLTLMPRSQNRLIPQYALEGEEVSGGVAERVLGHLYQGHEHRPLPRLVLAIRHQKPTHILVNLSRTGVPLTANEIAGRQIQNQQKSHKSNFSNV